MLCWPRGLNSRVENAFTRGRNNNFIELEVKTATQPLWLFIPLKQLAERGVIVLAGVIDPNYQRKIRLLLHHGGKGEYIWDSGDLLKYLLAFLCHVMKVNGKL